MAWGVDPTVQRAWDAPALDPALLKAIGLIFVELMLVTAIALFFSTFSTPILSAALTFGLFIVGHFSTDLRNFEQVVDSPAAARLARGLYWVLPNLAQFDVKAQVVHGQPVPPATGADDRVRGALHRDAARRRRRSSSRGGTSNRWPRDSLARIGRDRRRCRRAARRRGPAAGRARAALSAARRRARTSLYVTSGTRRPPPRRRVQRAGRRRLLDPRDSVLRRHQAAAGRRARRAGAAADAGRVRRTTTSCCIRCSTHDHARSALQHRLPVRRGVPRRAVSRRRRAARIWRSRCSKRDCATGPISGSTCRTSGSSTTGTTTTTAPRPSGSDRPSEVPGAPWWLRSLAATTLAQGGDRQSSRLMWEAIRAVGRDRLAAPRRRAAAAAAARARRDRRAAARRRRLRAARRAAAARLGGARAGRRASRRAARSEPGRRTS